MISREDMNQLQGLGRKAAMSVPTQGDPAFSRRLGTVVQVYDDGRLDVNMNSADKPSVQYGLRMTTACRGVAVNDVVVVDVFAHVPLVTGVIAHDSSHYVNEVAPGIRLVRAGSVGIVQVDYADFSPEKTIIRVAELGVRPVPIGGSGEYTGYMYVRGVAGTLGQLSVNSEGVLCAWVDRTAGAFWSGQVAFAVS